ncbi:hypothetical protein SETIT_5G350900v2 [Setaria italica]|uniref:Uncharacterized protein n=1 Tax=Setaria italica TaxID=4555 RepID=A0A368RC49_SETIT|nr:hypothetical protein SETIT_5G350900v2 [Setaria italica]
MRTRRPPTVAPAHSILGVTRRSARCAGVARARRWREEEEASPPPSGTAMVSPRRCVAVDRNANKCGARSASRREAMPAQDLQTAVRRADSSALRYHRMLSTRRGGRETVPLPEASPLPVSSGFHKRRRISQSPATASRAERNRGDFVGGVNL